MLALLQASTAPAVRYRLEVVNTWSPETHPGAFPAAAHFSWLGGATHGDAASFWAPGALASPGIQRMAETGETDTLLEEVDVAVAEGAAGSVLSWMWWFCPEATSHPSCGPLTVDFEIDEEYPLVTLATMLGPSPDWFVGVEGLALRADGQWLSPVVVELHPFDGGTRDANAFELFGPLTTPPEPISPVTLASGQRIGPDSLGRFVFTRLADCNDGLDNDGDGLVDLGEDPGCVHALGIEDPQCDDDHDNDGDGLVDWDGAAGSGPDPDCADATDNLEAPGCGLGAELVLLAALALRRRGRGPA